MDVLQAMESWATGNRLLSDIGFSPGVSRTSMFADDVVVFFRPLPKDLHVISSLQGLFGDGSSRRVNLNKCSVTYIRCDDSLAGSVVAFFSCKLQPFPLEYLGIPLSIYRLQSHHLEPLIEKFSGKMKGWKPKLLVVVGWLTLTKSILMALQDCDHLFILGRFSGEVWGKLRTWSATDFPIPGSTFGSTEEWWLRAKEKVHKNARSNFNTVVILVH
ncbi:hypothetical protein D1007_04806 [Hordeum vulgare]|nr:hypothetical protein D1007_04806 [Hordeum vulgare]